MPKLALLFDAESPHVDNYLEAAASARRVDEIAVAGPFAATRYPKFQTAGGTPWRHFANERELLERFRPQVSVVSYPADRSPGFVRMALEAGTHVIAEKPACVRAADFAPLARMADSKHLFLMLAVANRVLPLIRRARTLVQDGAIGTPYAAHLFLVADQTRLKSPDYGRSWVARKERAFGGFLSWVGIHYLDLLTYLTESSFTHASAITRNANRLPHTAEDSVAATLVMRNGLIASLHDGYYVDKGYQSGVSLWGSNGWLRFDVHGTQSGAGRTLDWMTYGKPGAERETFQADNSNAYALFVQEAIDADARNASPMLTAGHSLHLLRTLDAAYRSAASGRLESIG